MNKSKSAVFWITICAALHGCSVSEPSAEDTESQIPTTPEIGTMDRPYAQGRSFSNLDSYLAHLQKLSAQGIPFYQETPDGRFRYIKGRGAQYDEPVFFTRDELMKKFGFSS